MTNIHFHRLHICNFLSVGAPGITLDIQSGVSLITGINHDKDSRNGVGKSTLIESLYWVLFGTTIRDIKKDQVVNLKNKKDCKVTLNFSVSNIEGNREYILSREAKPSKVFLYEDGKDITKSTIAETDAFIISLINATSEVFQNAVIMTANNTVPFMSQKKGDKRKFIEDMLRLSIFAEMTSSIKEDLGYEKRKHETSYEKIQIYLKNINEYEEASIKNSKNKQIKLDELENRISSNKRDIDILRSKISHTEDIVPLQERNNILKTKHKTVSQEFNALKKLSHKFEFDIDHKQTELQKFLSSGNICTACNREFEEDHIHKKQDAINLLKEEIQTLVNKNDTLTEKLKTATEEIGNIVNEIEMNNVSIENIKNTQNKNKEYQDRIAQHELYIKYAEEDKLSLDNHHDDFNKLLIDTRSSLSNEQTNISNIQHRVKMLDTCKFVVSEEGVKSYIIKKILNLLNSKLNFYLAKLEAPCKCYFDEYFEEIIINENNQECTYSSFSGGERKRIDLAILFMFQDIRRLQSNVSINVSMYDELFDSALDEKGSECILSLLKERVEKNNESIYIVSHNKNTVKAGIDNIIFLEKKNGFTTVCQQQ